MKKLLKLLFVFALITAFVSCSNDNQDDINEPDTSVQESLTNNLMLYSQTANSTNQASDYLNDDIECFEVNFPFSVTDGVNTVVVNNEQELQDFIESLTPNSFFNIVFPINVTLEDGTEQTIADEMELLELIQSCFPDDIGNPGEDCFEFNFPLDVIDEEGNVITINGFEDLFYNDSVVDFVYPFTVTLADGSELTINSSEEFDDLYNECYDIETCDDCTENCFEIIFPINLIQEDGTVTTINDEDELYDFFENLGPSQFVTLTYPINVELSDGTQVAVNNDEEFDQLLSDCYGD